MRAPMIHAFRLKPGQDLRLEIQNFATEKGIRAGWIATCVGSLTVFSIRFANQPKPARGEGYFEIINLSGTVSINGSHLHISLSDHNGTTLGGHLMEGCLIYTTAEIVIQESPEYEFKRAKDGTTGWEELQITRTQNGL